MASLAEQLRAIQLRKSAEPMKDYSSPKTVGFTAASEIAEYKKKVLDVNTEKWLDILYEETFPTEYCPLYLADAELIVAIYERLYKNLDFSQIALINWQEKLNPHENELIQDMELRLGKVMNKFIKMESESDFVFVKTSSRSAKDAPLAKSAFKELYQQFLSEEPEDLRSNENMQIICLLKAVFQSMRLKTPSEVLDMIMRSERIYQDFLLALEFPEQFRENFVVRVFVDIDVDMEFRGFVFQGSLVALSQYNYLIFSQRLLSQKDAVKDRIQRFYKDNVKPKLDANNFEKNFIIDFAIGSKDQKLWVIEINPFLVTTDAALFSWEHERHLLEGCEGFQFRITTKPKPGAKAMLPFSIKNLLQP